MEQTTTIFDKLASLFDHKPVPEPGLYHYRREDDHEKKRLHLRIEPNGSGLLVINASRMVQLNPSATMMAYMHLEEVDPKQAGRVIHRHFRIPASEARHDYQDFCLQIERLLKPETTCPVCDLDLEINAPFSARPSAPYRMDLAITYRCNNDCTHCYNARSRRFPEISISEWKQIIDKIWSLSIPHIVFTGGEPTLYTGLPELIAYAEEKGLITGLNTNGRKLANPGFLAELVNAGLDHVQITFESHDQEIHNQMVNARDAWEETATGLKNVLDTRLFVMTNTTLLTHNQSSLQETLAYLADLGVPTVGLNALIYAGKGEVVGTGLREEDLPDLLEEARTFTQSRGQRLIWYTPTQYCHFNPMQLDLGVKGCTAALYNMCIEPNGDVIPCQSYYQSLGNFLSSTWSDIWEHPLALQLRDRTDVPQGCQSCEYLPECGGGCPLARGHQTINPIQNPIFST